MQKHEKLFDINPVLVNAMVIVGILHSRKFLINWSVSERKVVI